MRAKHVHDKEGKCVYRKPSIQQEHVKSLKGIVRAYKHWRKKSKIDTICQSDQKHDKLSMTIQKYLTYISQ